MNTNTEDLEALAKVKLYLLVGVTTLRTLGDQAYNIVSVTAHLLDFTGQVL